MANNDIGSKRLVVGAHYGLKDWMAQRATAVIMAVYTVLLLVCFLTAGELSHDAWVRLFTQTWMKVATFVALLALFWHAWIGVRDIWMDYIKSMALRVVLQVATIVWLVGCAGYALHILWRV